MKAANPGELANVDNLEQLYALLRTTGMRPGWNKSEPSLWPRPRKNFLPAHFSYPAGRAALESAGKFVSTELAERRNLILSNPVPGNIYGTARTMVAAYQMVMPHERARSHRHTPNALRLVMEAAPATYTVVDGRKIPMLPGDIVLTPNWSWHGHDNESEQCAYWIDFLDAPLVQLLEPMFLENLPGGFSRETEIVDENSAFRYSFADIKRRLQSASEVEPGLRTVLIGPKTLATMDMHVLSPQAGKNFADKRSTANAIFAVIEGTGASAIEGQSFTWGRGDVFVVPAWNAHEYRFDEPGYLLRVSDAPVMRRLGLLRWEG